MTESSDDTRRAGSVGSWDADAAQALSCLADPTRLQILLALTGREVNVAALCRLVGRMQPSISHHLSILRRTGIVTARKQGKAVYYSLAAPSGDAVLTVEYRSVSVSLASTATRDERQRTT